MSDTNPFVAPQEPATKIKVEQVLALIDSMTRMTERECRSQRIKAGLARRAEAKKAAESRHNK